jgi:hypothetical protein
MVTDVDYGKGLNVAILGNLNMKIRQRTSIQSLLIREIREIRGSKLHDLSVIEPCRPRLLSFPLGRGRVELRLPMPARESRP